MASNLKQIKNKLETKITLMYYFLKIRQTYTCMTVYSKQNIKRDSKINFLHNKSFTSFSDSLFNMSSHVGFLKKYKKSLIFTCI